MASIEQLKAAASKAQGFASPNLFAVTLPPFAGMSGNDLNLICKATELPGRQIMTQEQTIGTVMRKVASGYATVDINLTFYVLNDHKITKYFDEWQKKCHNPDERSYKVQYYVDYVKDIEIAQLQKGYSFSLFKKQLGFLSNLNDSIRARIFDDVNLAQGEYDFSFGKDAVPIRKVKLLEAFPTTVNAIQLGNDQEGITELTVQLSYKDWVPMEVDGPISGFGASVLTGVIGRIL